VKLTDYFNKLENVTEKIILILFGIFLAIFSAISLLTTTYFGLDYAEIALYKRDPSVCLLAAFILLVAAIAIMDKYYGIKKINTNKLLAVLLLYTFVAAVFWISITQSIPGADQMEVSKVAVDFSRDNFFAFEKGKYLFMYPFQLGITGLLEAVYRISGGEAFWVFQYLNAVLVCFGFYFMYKITNILFKDDKINNILLMLLFGCFPPIMYCAFVYGNIMSLMLCLFSLWMLLEYLETEKIWFAIAAIIAISLALIVKNNSLIVLTAMAVLLVLSFLKSRKIVNLLLVVLLILGSMLPVMLLNSFYESRSGIKINDGVPKIVWVAMGLQNGPSGPGWYNEYSYTAYAENNYDREKTVLQAEKSIADSMAAFQSNPGYADSFFYEKFVSQWNDPSYQGFWVSRRHEKEYSDFAQAMFYGQLHENTLAFMDGYQFIIIFGAFSFVLMARKRICSKQLILGITILGGFLFHMVWEAKGQYVMPYFLMIIPYSAAGLSLISDHIQAKFSKSSAGTIADSQPGEKETPRYELRLLKNSMISDKER